MLVNGILIEYERPYYEKYEVDEKTGEIVTKIVYEIPTEREELIKAIKDTLFYLFEKKTAEVFREHGYYSLADVMLYRESEEGGKLLSWYKRFDENIWNYIENQLSELSTEELFEMDVKNVIENLTPPIKP